MSTSSIVVPAGLTGDILGVASSTFSNFSGILTIIVGLLLAMTAIGMLINAFHKN